MSQFDLNQLSKKTKNLSASPNTNCLKTGNQRKKQKASSKKSFQPSKKIKEKEFLPGPFWAPTVWANSFSEKERYEREHPALNDAPSLMILDSFLFIFGVFAAISAFMNLVAPRRTGYGLITLILGSLTGALLLYLMYYFFYQYMDGTKRS